MTGSTQPARGSVVIVDDHPIAMHGLEAPLRSAGFDVHAGSSTVEQLEPPGQPAVAVCDLRLPGRSGGDAVSFVADKGYRVLATSGVATAEEVLDVIAAGASGYISKTAPPATFVMAVAKLLAGGMFVSPELASFLATDARHRPLQSGEIGSFEREALHLLEQGDSYEEAAASLGIDLSRFDSLLENVRAAACKRRRQHMPSPREIEILRLVAEGLTHRQLAERMCISAYTVPDMLERVKSKYLSTHPDAPSDMRPLAAARSWAKELGYA